MRSFVSYIALLFFVVFVFVSCATTSTTLIERDYFRSVRILAEDFSNPCRPIFAAGFDYRGYSITAAHVIRALQQISYPINVLALDSLRDVSIVGLANQPSLRPARRFPAFGEEVIHFFFRRHIRFMAVGEYLGPSFDTDESVIEEQHLHFLRGTTALGVSGSPVLNRRGELLGMSVITIPSAWGGGPFTSIKATSAYLYFVPTHVINYVIDAMEQGI